MNIVMKILLLGTVLLGFAFASGHVGKAFAVSTPFTRTLTVGSSGEDVRELQKMLNRDTATSIRGTGPGSQGQETLYFGALTRDAVIRFQERYTAQVLLPNGLQKGTGFVGPSTRAVLAALLISYSNTPASTPQPVAETPTVAATPQATSTVTSTPENPNLKNIDKFFEALDKLGPTQGYSATDIAAMKASVLEQAATTTDLRAAFLKTVEKDSSRSAQSSSLLGKLLATIENVFRAEHAHAATGAPFGGALLFAVSCNGGVWNITITPLPPSYVTLLSYQSGTQAFASYNIPFTRWLLGNYTPGPGLCFIGPIYIPSQGLIMPLVGSSPS